jgi:hypothetical protein
MKSVLEAKLSRDDFIVAYLKIWNGALKLTDKEFSIVVEIVKLYMSYIDQGVKEPALSELVFRLKNMQKLREDLSISKQNWTNYKARLLEKKIVLGAKEGQILNPLLYPKEELTFKFEII